MRIAKSTTALLVLVALPLGAVSSLSAQARQPAKGTQAGKQPAAKAQGASKAFETKAAAQVPVPSDSDRSAKTVARRDPFEPLVSKQGPGAGIPERLPPGKAGLVISTLRIDGLVRGPNGMIAVVSNPQQRVYFLREGDQLYDGRVEKITMEAVSFHQTGKDAFGKPVERQVSKRLYPSPGEQP